MDPRLRAVASLAAVCGLALAIGGCTRVDPGPSASRPTPPASTPPSASSTASSTPTTIPTTTPPPTTRPLSTCPKPPDHFVMQAPGSGKTVALTFDDGPGPDDAAFASILDRYQVHATFFETGAHIAAHPDQVSMLAAHGNLVAGHSWDHRYPRQVASGWSVSYLKNQFGRTATELATILHQPSCYVRPPGGFRTNVLATGSDLRLTAVLWSIDSLDWQQPGHTTAKATASIVARATAAGGSRHPIVLMHSGKASHEPDSRVSPYRGNTVAALPAVIEWYQQHGYRFVRLDGRS